MSINTNMTKQSPQLRTISDPVGNSDVSVRKSQEVTELEISLPMLLVIIIGIGILIYGAIYFFGPKTAITTGDKKQPETITESLADVTNVSLEDAEVVGDPKAKHIFAVMSDFECPACQFYENGTTGIESVSSQIKKQYVDTGIIRTAFLPYVLVPSHKPAATSEVVGFFCAKDQGKASAYNAEIFKNTLTNGLGIDGKGTERKAMLALIKNIGLDEQKFTECYDKRDIVKMDTIEQRINAQVRNPWTEQKGDWFGTPAFVICTVNQESPLSCSGKAFVGVFSFEDTKIALDTYLGKDAPK
jgi:hypothetical protein